MYSKFDTDKKLLMVGFDAENFNLLIDIISFYIKQDGIKQKKARDVLTFLETSKLAVATNK
jgi:hypothetical protein